MNISNIQTKLMNNAFCKYSESKNNLSILEANLDALAEYKPRLMRMGARHMNKPWFFANQQNVDLVTNEIIWLNEYYKAYNAVGYCIEYIMAYEYLLFLIYHYSNPPENLETRMILPIDLVDTIDRIILDFDNQRNYPKLQLAESLVLSYHVDKDMWYPIWEQRGFQYPRIHE